ncbi:MAG: 5'-nucleotidase C-terminal domain-containing protein [Sphaerochaetaceae bacterium]|jgi:2',3'-cyclic-nucleotide 2'-phosphodiesterase/3'-nucleotidase
MKYRNLFFRGIALLMALGVLVACASTESIPIIQEPEPLVIEPVKDVVQPPSEQKEVVIVVTANVNGEVVAPGGLSHLASYLKQQNQQERALFLLEGGNILQGSLETYYSTYNVEKQPHIVSLVLDALGYDAALSGPRDLEAGFTPFRAVVSQAHYPYLAANVVDAKTKEPLLEPYVILKQKGLTIGVMGLIDPVYAPLVFGKGVEIQPMEEAALHYIDIIKEEKPDLMIALVQTKTAAGSSFASEFDLVFTLGTAEGEHVVSMPQNGSEFMTVTAAFDQGQLVSLEPQMLKAADYPVDQMFEQRFGQFVTEAQSWGSTIIGNLSESISSKEGAFGDSKFVDLIHAVEQKETLAPISLASLNAVDTVLHKGPVSIQDLLAFGPFTYPIITMRLSGSEIRSYLEYSYAQWFNQMRSLDDDLLLFTEDMRANWELYDSLAGVNYVVDITKGPSQKISLKTLAQGGAFSSEQTYEVALSAKRALGEGGHLKAAGLEGQQILDRMLRISDTDLLTLLAEEFLQTEELVPTSDSNWLVIPNLWMQRGMKSSYPKL